MKSALIGIASAAIPACLSDSWDARRIGIMKGKN
jgi:hypothetical protein